VETLRCDGFGAAALDAFEEEPLPPDSPLWGFENVLITPHMAGTSRLLNKRKTDLFVENYWRLHESEALRNRVV